MAMIAERAGVSKNTVSLALRHDPQIPEPQGPHELLQPIGVQT